MLRATAMFVIFLAYWSDAILFNAIQLKSKIFGRNGRLERTKTLTKAASLKNLPVATNALTPPCSPAATRPAPTAEAICVAPSLSL